MDTRPADWLGGFSPRPPLATADVPDDLEGRYRLVVETFERLVGGQLAVLTTVRLTIGLLARARDAIFTHSLRSYDAVMLALANEAASRAGAGRHLATFDGDFLAVPGLELRTGRRPRQPAQDAQAPDVRPRQSRPTSLSRCRNLIAVPVDHQK